MEEIIAKSKAAKAQRAKDKEDDIAQHEQLDAEFKELLQVSGIFINLPVLRVSDHETARRQEARGGGGVHEVNGEVILPTNSVWLQSQALQTMIRDKKSNKSTEVEHDPYDIAQRALVFDVRGQAGERVKTQEETAVLEAKRLEQLEKERLRRMHTELGEADAEIEDELLTGNGQFSLQRALCLRALWRNPSDAITPTNKGATLPGANVRN